MILEARWPDGGIQAQWINPTPEQEANFRTTMTRQGCTVQVFDDQEYLACLEQRRSQKAQEKAVPVKQSAGNNVDLHWERLSEPAVVQRHIPEASNLFVEFEEPYGGLRTRVPTQENAGWVAVHREFAALLLLGRPLPEFGWAQSCIDSYQRSAKRWAEVDAAWERDQAHYAALERQKQEMAEEFAREAVRFEPSRSPVQDVENGAGGLTLPEVGDEIVHPVIGWATVTHTVTLDGQAVPVATGPRGQGLVRPGQWREATEIDRPFWKRGDVNTSTCVQLDNPTTLPAPPAQPRKASIMPSLF